MLIDAVKQRLNSTESKIILWGSDHGASLATWAKRVYPEKIDGKNLLADILIIHVMKL